MPNVIEMEETLAEIRQLPSCETPQQAPAPRPGFAGRITAVLKGMVARRNERMECHDGWEMPLDTLARKHPYMYADALLG